MDNSKSLNSNHSISDLASAFAEQHNRKMSLEIKIEQKQKVCKELT
jgi:hypothetical protein